MRQVECLVARWIGNGCGYHQGAGRGGGTKHLSDSVDSTERAWAGWATEDHPSGRWQPSFDAKSVRDSIDKIDILCIYCVCIARYGGAAESEMPVTYLSALTQQVLL